MEQIYLLEDINGLKYVGRTKQQLYRRIIGHKNDKKRGHYCSSSKLDLEKCKKTVIDIADSEKEARELEEFYINSIDCVNEAKLNAWQFGQKQYDKDYHQKNKEKRNAKANERNRKAREKYHAIKMQREPP